MRTESTDVTMSLIRATELVGKLGFVTDALVHFASPEMHKEARSVQKQVRDLTQAIHRLALDEQARSIRSLQTSGRGEEGVEP